MKKLILIDAHAIIHRSYHALPPLTTPAGEPIGAVYGFATILLRILRELKPDYIAAAFDLPGPTFRHIAYERYKAQRPETPSDLGSQFAKTEELLAAFAIPVFKEAGYEADDIIATMAEQLKKPRRKVGVPTSLSKNKKEASGKDMEIAVVTGDLDALQLVGPGLKVYAMKKGVSETVIYDGKAVKERYGLEPGQLLDFKGLKGDPSDNIPGVKGVGEKTAAELIRNFGSVEGVYKALKKRDKRISSALAEKLRAGEEEAKFSKELARMNTKVPLKFNLEDIRWRDGSRTQEIKNLFQKFGFFSLLKRIENGISVPLPKEKKQSQQVALLTENPKSALDLRVPQTWKEADISADQDWGLILFKEDLYLIPGGENRVLRLDKKLLAEPGAKKFLEENKFFTHDSKALIRFLRVFAIELGKIGFDTLLAAYLAGSFSRDFSYPAVVSRELARAVSPDPREEFVHFFEIVKILKEKLAAGEMEKIFREMELPLARILADMEEQGLLIDRKFLAGLGKKVDGMITKLVTEIHELAGEEFNLNSSRQLSAILFEKIGLKTYGLRKTEKGGVVSTRESELEKLKGEHPMVEKILEYRELIKLKNTYIDVLPELVDKKSGRLHTTLNQAVTVTGRLSSSEPNLQNIPIMSEMGREIRKAFVAEKGFVLVSFDYSQIELRVAAHLANDRKMIEAFRQGLDIHKLTAAEIYNVPLDKVTPDFRRAAKTLNFGVLYGMGPQAFAESTGFSREQAKNFISEYFRDFSGIREYVVRTKRFAEENGYVETLFGRRRYIPEIHSPNWQLKREAERMAVNAPIQGSAADLVKMAMIGVDKWIKKEKLGQEARMLLQVHDELLFEIKKDVIKQVTPQIRALMEGVAKLKVPLVVDVKVGENWGEQELVTSN